MGRRGPEPKLHCINGHLFTKKNQYFRRMDGGRIQKRCLKCRQIADQRKYTLRQYGKALDLLYSTREP